MSTGGYTSNSGYGSSKDPEPSPEPNYNYPFAIAGLVAGVVSLFFNPLLIASAIGAVSGGIGIRHAVARRTPEGRKPGFAVAIAALVLSALGALGTILILTFGVPT